MAALATSSLADAAAPYGIEAFDSLLEPLWVGLNGHRGKSLASFLKAVGSLIPLMDEKSAAEYIKLVLSSLIKEFENTEEEMKRVLLKVVHQCLENGQVPKAFIEEKLAEPFWQHFWLRKLCSDPLSQRLLVDATASFAPKLGVNVVLPRLILFLKEDHEQLRQTSMKTVVAILNKACISEVSVSLEDSLIDASMFAFHQQIADDNNVLLEGLIGVFKALGLRSSRFLPGLVANICVRLKTTSSKVRQQAADLVTGLAPTLGEC